MKIKVIASILVLLAVFGPAALPRVQARPMYSSITPALAGETNTTANASSDPNENEANAATGFSCVGTGCALAAISGDYYAGAYSLELTSGAAANYVGKGWTIGNNTWAVVSVYLKDTSGNTGRYNSINSSTSFSPAINVTTAWAHYYIIVRSTDTAIYPRFYNETAGNKTAIDNYSIRPITTSTLFGDVSSGMTENVYVSANWTITPYTQGGVVAALDSASNPKYFVIGYYNRALGTAVLDKCVNGVYTNLINTAKTYAVGGTVEIRRAGNTYQLFYNGSQAGTDQTVSDAGMGYLYGAFSTYSGNTYTGLAFTENSTATPTVTNTYTPTATFTPTFTHTLTFTPLPSHTFTPTFTFTPTETFTPTFTFTPSLTPTPGGPAEVKPEMSYGDMAILAAIAALILIVSIYAIVRWFQAYFDKKR